MTTQDAEKATVADMAPMVAENRILVRAGIEQLRSGRRPGVRALMERASVSSDAADEIDIAEDRIAAARRRHFISGARKSLRMPVPVIVVGNLTIGGTGKTPLVLWLCEWLKTRGLRPGILSGGYRGNSSQWPRRVGPESDPETVGDEAVLLARRSGVPVMADPLRTRSAALEATSPSVAATRGPEKGKREVRIMSPPCRALASFWLYLRWDFTRATFTAPSTAPTNTIANKKTISCNT